MNGTESPDTFGEYYGEYYDIMRPQIVLCVLRSYYNNYGGLWGDLIITKKNSHDL
jgi:hypothetical protein